MLGYRHLAAPSPAAISEDLVTGLLGERLSAASGIVAEELPRPEGYDDGVAYNGEVGDGSHISAVYAPACEAAVGTFPEGRIAHKDGIFREDCHIPCLRL